MEVILLEKIHGLGNLGERVNVKPGFARNFLIPSNKAVFSTKENVAAVEARRAELEAKAEKTLHDAKERAQKLTMLQVSIPAHSSDEGKLYGSVGVRELSIAITAAGVNVERHEIRLGEGPIRSIGEHTITVALHSDVIVDMTVNVIPE
jgi:large subunit ribosomal protein L9